MQLMKRSLVFAALMLAGPVPLALAQPCDSTKQRCGDGPNQPPQGQSSQPSQPSQPSQGQSNRPSQPPGQSNRPSQPSQGQSNRPGQPPGQSNRPGQPSGNPTIIRVPPGEESYYRKQ